MRLFVLQKKLLQFFQKKDYKIWKILKDINFIPHLSYLSHILGVMNHCYCYLQGPGCNIVDFAFKLAVLGVGKEWLASHKRFFYPRLVVFQLFVRNTEDLFLFCNCIFCFTHPIFCSCVVEYLFLLFHPPFASPVRLKTFFLLFDSPVATLRLFFPQVVLSIKILPPLNYLHPEA